MKNLVCNQINIFINIEIRGEEDKNNIYIYIYILNLKKFLHFGEITFII